MVNSVVVVLGAASTNDGKASPCLTRRTLSGCSYALEKEDAALLLCGGRTNAHHALKEADIMADLAIGDGFPEDRIVREAQSRNTLENTIFAKRIIKENGWDNIYVVTDPIHIPRAKMVFKVLGVKAQFLKTHREPKVGASVFGAALYEATALLWYAVRLLSGHHKQYRTSK
jgi:uncharacterized SAM-binding protein YcdF (DUF218 family)